jgi:protein-L-isoaspartate O-methyltransferase
MALLCANFGLLEGGRRLCSRMLNTPVLRWFFCGQAYQDHPHGIGYGVTMSAPHMHAHCLEVLEPVLQEAASVLDVGSGTGYLTACMGHMVTCKIRNTSRVNSVIV